MKNLAFVLFILLADVTDNYGQPATSINDWHQFIDRTVSMEYAASRLLNLSPGHYVVKLNKHIKISDVTTNSVQILRKLSSDFLVIEILPANDKKHLPVLFQQAWHANNLWKLSPDLLSKVEQGMDERASYIVRMKPGFNHRLFPEFIQNLIEKTGKNGYLTLKTDIGTIIKAIMVADEVMYIGFESNRPVEESPVLDLNLNPNAINKIHHEFPLLNGNSMTISIKELAYNETDIDLNNRHVPSSLRAVEISNHATEMATIAAGAGNSFITGKGVAWSSNITSSDFSEQLPDDDKDYKDLNISVQNHSYGTVIENFYGSKAAAFDISAHRNPWLLHIFSSGNQGLETASGGVYQHLTGYANLTGNFKMAKNILTVGAVDTLGRVMPFSSRGPAYDGRVKPELVAYSTVGSSNSAALVSGLSILLQQKYLEMAQNLPPSALLKALLINSARDVGDKGIDYATGYGNVDAYHTLKNLMEKRFISGEVSHDEKRSFNLTVPEYIENLKVTIVWTDPAALPNANRALVNDLDMTLKGNHEVWFPWILNPAPDLFSLSQPATRGEDHLNNIEQISLQNPQAGNYMIEVNGFDVPAGSQSFYIAYQFEQKDQFTWLFPTASDNMPYNGETGSYFRWHSTLDQPVGKLEYSLDHGKNWETLAAHVNLEKGFYRWEPGQRSGLARVRMMVEGVGYESDAFTLGSAPKVSIGFNCEDSVLIQWGGEKQAMKYELFTMEEGQAFLTPRLVTSDTALILKKSDYAATKLAVQPVISHQLRNLRSSAFDYESLGSGCYLRSFFTETLPDEGIRLFVDVGTAYGIDEMVFERKENGSFIGLESIKPKSVFTEYLDSQPKQGLNTHRVKIKLINGETVTTHAIHSYFLTDMPFLVFPNPVVKPAVMRIFSKDFEGQEVIFRLINSSGQLVLRKKMTTEIESVQTTGLSPGLYFYSFEVNGVIYKDKIVIN